METVEYIELFWDCPECGQRHISAVFNPQGHRCPNCLYWRVEDVELYEAADSQVITDSSLINRQPFWVCKVCNAVNEDSGLPAHLLQCSNCDNYQTSEDGGITGNVASDRQGPDTVAVGEPVQVRGNVPATHSQNAAHSLSQNRGTGGRFGVLAAGFTGLAVGVGGLLGVSMLSSQMSDPALLQVQVTNLEWRVELDVQEQKLFTRQSWDESVPSAASVVKSENKRRGTRQEQRGFQTVMIQQRYQSGTRTKTYFDSERYQSGTRTETYFDSERYQSGTRQKCKTISQGNGIGKRTCQDVPIYSTRQVKRTRQVPIYSTRQVRRTRQVPVYSTRRVPVKKPILVNVPVQDTWVTYRINEWVAKQTHTQKGRDDMPRRPPDVKLTQKPPQRISATRTTCLLSGIYSVKNSWLEAPESQSGNWTLPCQDYDRINIGQLVRLRSSGSDSANLVRVLSP